MDGRSFVFTRQWCGRVGRCAGVWKGTTPDTPTPRHPDTPTPARHSDTRHCRHSDTDRHRSTLDTHGHCQRAPTLADTAPTLPRHQTPTPDPDTSSLSRNSYRTQTLSRRCPRALWFGMRILPLGEWTASRASCKALSRGDPSWASLLRPRIQ
jgi:hypothetical protein